MPHTFLPSSAHAETPSERSIDSERLAAATRRPAHASRGSRADGI